MNTELQLGTTTGGNGSVSARILDTVASHLGCDPIDLPPLYDVLDPDAVEALVGSLDAAGGVGRLAFTYCDCDIVLTAASSLRCVVSDADCIGC
jgi:hypothetical protein